MLKEKRGTILLWIAAVFTLCVCAGLFLVQEKKREYSIVFLGDSVIGNVWDDSGVTNVMEERLDKKVLKGAFGGTTMAVGNKDLWGSMIYTDLSLYELVRSICSGDFGQQKAGLAYGYRYMDINTQVLDYFKEYLEALSEVDFDKVEAVVIQHGTNDYNKGLPLDNPEDRYDKATFAGALRSSIERLRKTYPDLRIVLMTPIYCELGPDGIRKCYDTDYGGGYLEEYVDMEIRIAGEYGVDIIDAYHDSGIWEDTAEVYLEDRLHPSAEGRKLLGNMISDYLINKE